MLFNICIALLLMVLTTAIHAGGMILSMRVIHYEQKHQSRHLNVFWVSGIVLLMFLASLFEVMLWAITYIKLGAIEGLEKAVYFSMVTFTTVGYGDIFLDEHWRLLASFEAANGVIMFGWTTAVVMAAVHKIYIAK